MDTRLSTAGKDLLSSHGRWALAPVAVALFGALGASCTDVPGSTDDEVVAAPIAEAEEALTCMTLQRGNGRVLVQDAQVTSDLSDPNKASTSYGAAPDMRVGAAGTSESRALLKFELARIPRGSPISSAWLTLYAEGVVGVARVSVHPSPVDWSEATVTWSTSGLSFDPRPIATFSATASQPTRVDLTSVVAKWTSGAMPNDGVLLDHPDPGRVTFATSEATDAAHRPTLVVCYVPKT